MPDLDYVSFGRKDEWILHLLSSEDASVLVSRMMLEDLAVRISTTGAAYCTRSEPIDCTAGLHEPEAMTGKSVGEYRRVHRDVLLLSSRPIGMYS